MNKKKLGTTLASLALVGAIGVGATLAYLSDRTGTITNTFTLGNNIDIQITEENLGTDKDTNPRIIADATTDKKSQNYTDLTPGVAQTKDPRVDLKNDSNACYVYIELTGLQTFLNKDIDGNDDGDFVVRYNSGTTENPVWTEGLNPLWKKISSEEGTLDGTYVLKVSSAQDAENDVLEGTASSPAIFDQIMIKEETGTYTNTDLSNLNIIVRAVAIQSDNVSNTNANEEALGILAENPLTQN